MVGLLQPREGPVSIHPPFLKVLVKSRPRYGEQMGTRAPPDHFAWRRRARFLILILAADTLVEGGADGLLQ